MKGDENLDPVDSGTFLADLPRRFLTLSNILSLVRLFLSVPFAVVVLDGSDQGRLWGAILMVVAAITDKLDGDFARKFHQTSEWGKILDPLADKIAVGTVIAVLFVVGDLPAWFLIIALGRDLVILSGGIYLKRRTGILVPSNQFGKWTVGLISVTLFVLVLSGRSTVGDYLLAINAVLLLLSLGLYGKRFKELLGMKRVENGAH